MKTVLDLELSDCDVEFEFNGDDATLIAANLRGINLLPILKKKEKRWLELEAEHQREVGALKSAEEGNKDG